MTTLAIPSAVIQAPSGQAAASSPHAIDAPATLDQSPIDRMEALRRSVEGVFPFLRGRLFMSSPNRSTHIRLTSHPEPNTGTIKHPIKWGAKDPQERGPIIGSVTNPADRNVIGAHGGSYSLYRALAISARAMNPLSRPDLHNTHPTAEIGPNPQWFDPGKI